MIFICCSYLCFSALLLPRLGSPPLALTHKPCVSMAAPGRGKGRWVLTHTQRAGDIIPTASSPPTGARLLGTRVASGTPCEVQGGRQKEGDKWDLPPVGSNVVSPPLPVRNGLGKSASIARGLATWGLQHKIIHPFPRVRLK